MLHPGSVTSTGTQTTSPGWPRPTRRMTTALARRPIGGGRDDQPVQALDAPPLVHELHRQPIEQFRVARRLALDAEILGRRHQPDAEVLQPDAIDEDACRCRSLAVDQPAREGE